MVDDYLPDVTVITNVFKNMSILGDSGMLLIIISFLSMVLITRDVEKWKVLWFPIMVVLWAMGIPLGGLGVIALIFALILLAIETQSIQIIGNVVSGVRTGLRQGSTKGIKIFRGISGGLLGATKAGRKRLADIKEDISKEKKLKSEEKRAKLTRGQVSRESKRRLKQQQEQFKIRQKNEKQRRELDIISKKLSLARFSGRRPKLNKKEQKKLSDIFLEEERL